MDWNLVIKPLLSGGTSHFNSDNAVAVISAINEKYVTVIGNIQHFTCFCKMM